MSKKKPRPVFIKYHSQEYFLKVISFFSLHSIVSNKQYIIYFNLLRVFFKILMLITNSHLFFKLNLIEIYIL